MSPRPPRRRRFLQAAASLALLGSIPGANRMTSAAPRAQSSLSLFLCGDVMPGRGIDQLFPVSVDPRLREPYVEDAREYLRLAEAASGPIPRRVEPDYIWGEALAILREREPDVRIINLETAVTTSDAFWPGKGIHYRMHPANVACLTAAGTDVCVVANNHVMDFGRAGLAETLQTLTDAGLRPVGAGADREAAKEPVGLPIGNARRLWVAAVGATSSGIPEAWAPTASDAGVNIAELSTESADALAAQLAAVKRAGDLALVSIHWGGNWGYAIPAAQRDFAHRLIDSGEVDLVHGHSSHHPKGIEVYRGHLVLYGCGDFLNDYEGIRGYEAYRGDLGLMYFPRLDPAGGQLLELDMVPTRIHRLRIERADRDAARWLAEMLEREGRDLGTRVTRQADGSLRLIF